MSLRRGFHKQSPLIFLIVSYHWFITSILLLSFHHPSNLGHGPSTAITTNGFNCHQPAMVYGRSLAWELVQLKSVPD